MNKPAAKEPSMDEILSSIRQIIADDDEPAEAEASDSGKSETDADAAMTAEETKDPEADASSEAPLELSADQLVSESKSKPEADADLDIEFSPVSSGMDVAPPPEPETVEVVEAEPVVPEKVDKVEEVDVAEAEGSDEDTGSEEANADLVIADDISFEDAGDAVGENTAPIEDLVSMPDPDLSSDMAEKLLEPTTTAAVGSAFARLGALSAIGGDNLTLEAIVREMLRPMLKEWLDENLPATVERMVEKEIERVSRGS